MTTHNQTPRETDCRSISRRRASHVHASFRASSIDGRAARQRPRPGTGGNNSHAGSTYNAANELRSFVDWFADWWLRRGRGLTDPIRHAR